MAELIVPRKTVRVSFSLEPAYNAVASLSLLDMAEDFSGLGEWVYRTAEDLSLQRRRTNRQILRGVAAYLGDLAWTSYEAWVDDLAARDAAQIRMDLVRTLFAQAWERAERDLPSEEDVIADRAAYLFMLELAFPGEGQADERALWEDMHGELIDPSLVQQRMVDHLRAVWEGGLEAEWARHLPELQESVAAFESLDMSGLTAMEALMRASMRDVPPPVGSSWLDEVEHLILIPSVHTGPYLLHLHGLDPHIVRVVYGARVPESRTATSPTLTRSELLMRLSALANDTRLRVLALVGQEGEMGTAEIMEQLSLSQSAASRHLEHLSATGYLTVRGESRVKHYSLCIDQMDRTLESLKAFCQP